MFPDYLHLFVFKLILFFTERNMRGDDAKKFCPEIELIQVPVAHGKADLTQYREAGSEVMAMVKY